MKLINSRDFVKAWMTSDTIDQVAAKMGITKESAYSKANNLRFKGVKLPQKQRVYGDSVDDLNAIVERYENKNAY